jgi:hypothetical protein
MGDRKRVTWRLDAENFDLIWRYMRRKKLRSMNDALNLRLAELREQEEYSAVTLLSDTSTKP